MATAPTSPLQPTLAFDRPAQIRAVIVGLAFVAVFYNVLLDLRYKWYHSADWSHGWLIPLFSVYLVYLHWDRVRRTPIRHTWVGLLLMIVPLGLWGLMILYGLYGAVRCLGGHDFKYAIVGNWLDG